MNQVYTDRLVISMGTHTLSERTAGSESGKHGVHPAPCQHEERPKKTNDEGSPSDLSEDDPPSAGEASLPRYQRRARQRRVCSLSDIRTMAENPSSVPVPGSI